MQCYHIVNRESYFIKNTSRRGCLFAKTKADFDRVCFRSNMTSSLFKKVFANFSDKRLPYGCVLDRESYFTERPCERNEILFTETKLLLWWSELPNVSWHLGYSKRVLANHFEEWLQCYYILNRQTYFTKYASMGGGPFTDTKVYFRHGSFKI